MALQITTNINVDFYDNKYIMINAKQYDDKSRLISVTCYNQGDIYNISSRNHTAYIKYRKADGRWVLNCCTINNKGQILIELTEQMLAAAGVCYVDLFIVNKGSAIVNIDTGSIVTVDGSSVLTTKAFYIDVQEAVVDNSLIESVDEYNGITDLLNRAEAEYSEVIQSAKSYAIGTNNYARENDEKDNSKYYSQVSKSYAIGGTGVRTGENTDNSKYYSQLSKNSADNADESEANAKSHMDAAKSHMDTTKSYMDTTKSYMDDAKSYMDTAKSHMDTANEHKNNAKTYMDNALVSEQKAKTSEQNAKTSETNADASEASAKAAQTAAEIAQGNAEDAQSAAETAQQKSEQAQSAAEMAQGAAETAQQNAEQAALTAAQDAVNDVLSIMNDHVIASQESETNAKASEQAAKVSETNAQSYMNETYTNKQNAKDSETNAKTSENNALNSANLSQSYAVGGTGIRANENEDNAHYYYELIKTVVESINNSFIPMGTVSFSELATVDKDVGYVYNISDDFVTDETFREGEGKSYTAGTNVYYTANGYWDCFGGAASPIATVDEVKEYLGIE